MKRFVVAGAVILCSILPARADVRIRQQSQTPAMMGQQAQTETTDVWLGDGVVASVGGKMGMVLDMNAKKMFMINNEAKTYFEADLPLDIRKMVPPEAAAMMDQMMKGIAVSVEKTGATKKVAGIDTVSYKVTMTMMGMPMVSTYWVASSGLPFDWKKYQKINAQMTGAMMQGGEKVIQELEKLEGYPLATETNMMGMKVTTETVEIQANATPPAGVYGPPKGYTKQAAMGMK